jgi:hypothetical protein
MGEQLPTHCPECHRELRYLGDVEQYPVLRVSARAIHRDDKSPICPGASKAEDARAPGLRTVSTAGTKAAVRPLPVGGLRQQLQLTEGLCGVARAVALAVVKRYPFPPGENPYREGGGADGM